MDTLSTPSQFPTTEMYKELERNIANLSRINTALNLELESWLAAVPPGHDQRLANYGIKARRPAKTAV